jgi:hypothetical protein
VGPDGTWHHLVGTVDSQGLSGSAGLTFYIDGTNAGTAGLPGALVNGIIDSQAAISIGAESSEPGPTFDLAYNGAIDEVAIYPASLSAVQVSNHFAAAYGPNLAAFITSEPASVTNFVTYPATLSVRAAGTTPLVYQWYQNGVAIPGANSGTYTVPSLALSDAGTYTVSISNTLTGGVVAGTKSAPAVIDVLPVPTTPPSISGLVLHLTFDNTLADSSGKGHDATYATSGTYTTNSNPLANNFVQGQIGEAFSYETDVNTNSVANGGFTNAWYATLGVVPDLKFGTNSFTVSLWVELPVNATPGDLPFFGDLVGSTFGFPGFVFDPAFDTGGWGYSVFGSTDTGIGVYGTANSINGPNDSTGDSFRNLIYVIDRVNGATIYLDGQVAAFVVQAGTSVTVAGNIDNTNAAVIGQDPTGQYSFSGSDYPSTDQPSSAAYIDDLGVWNRALTPLEAESIYLAGSVNQLSFTTPTNTAVTLGIAVVTGNNLSLSWSAGALQGAASLGGPWTNVVGATSPYTNAPSGSQGYFRIKD